MISPFLSALVFFPILAMAHQGHEHHHESPKPTESAEKVQQDRFRQINEAYEKTVKPAFQRSCFDCHSQSPRTPWYYSLPIANGMIDKDMQEAKEHLDFSDGFPFHGHGTPRSDLEAIAESIKKDEMPPTRYRLMHWGSALTDKERRSVLQWIEESLKVLPEEAQ